MREGKKKTGSYVMTRKSGRRSGEGRMIEDGRRNGRKKKLRKNIKK